MKVVQPNGIVESHLDQSDINSLEGWSSSFVSIEWVHGMLRFNFHESRMVGFFPIFGDLALVYKKSKFVDGVLTLSPDELNGIFYIFRGVNLSFLFSMLPALKALPANALENDVHQILVTTKADQSVKTLKADAEVIRNSK